MMGSGIHVLAPVDGVGVGVGVGEEPGCDVAGEGDGAGEPFPAVPAVAAGGGSVVGRTNLAGDGPRCRVRR